MKSKTLATALIILGLVMIIYTGFDLVTTEKVADLGPLKIEKEKNHFIQWSPFVGVALLLGGIVLIIRKPSN
jgi:hypothetical protein